MRLILVRHAAVAADPELAPEQWPLSDEGRTAARSLAQRPVWNGIERLYCSPELRAHETAQIIAGPNGITVTLVEDLRETRRPARQWFDDYPAAVAAYFAAPETPVHGWEPATIATNRIRGCIDRLVAAERHPFGIVGHGLTLALYLSTVTGSPAARLWPAMALPDLAIVDAAQERVLHIFGGPRDA